MNNWFLTISFISWGEIYIILLAIYLFFVFLKQSFKRTHEVRAICLAIALVVLPLLLGVHYLGHWDFTEEAEFNQMGHWWVAPIEDIEKTADGIEIIHEHPFNLITFGLYLCLLYIGASLFVWLLAWYFLVKQGTRLLAIRRLLIKLAMLLIGVMIYLKYEGIDLTPLWVGMGAASIIVGIALQEPLSSLFKGVALDLEGVFHRGEWIRVGGKSGVAGQVVDKNWRTTKIMTIDDELITIPNSILGSEQILNYNQPDAAHVHRLNVGTSYNDPPVKVKEILRTILIREPRIEQYPPPAIRTIKYNDFSIDYELKFWIRDYGQHPSVNDAVMTRIWYAFKFYGIEIPFPIRTVHLKEQEHLKEEAETIDRKVMDVRDYLHSLSYFSAHLNKNDIEFLARNAFQRTYSSGEHVIHKGEMGDALYVVRSGWCEAVLPNGERRRLKAGEYFGEMGLISLQPRTVDVVAGPETGTIIRVDRECMQVLFKRYPGLKNEFEKVRDTRMDDSGFKTDKVVLTRVPLAVRIIRNIKDIIIPW